MSGVRIRWKALGKVAAVAVAGLVAMQALPGLLRAPEPPPLSPDVGLPRVRSGAGEVPTESRPPRDPIPRKRPQSRSDRPGAKRRDVLSSGHSGTKRISTPNAPAPFAAAPEPARAPEPAPAPPPGDGSVEFMPH